MDTGWRKTDAYRGTLAARPFPMQLATWNSSTASERIHIDSRGAWWKAERRPTHRVFPGMTKETNEIESTKRLGGKTGGAVFRLGGNTVHLSLSVEILWGRGNHVPQPQMAGPPLLVSELYNS